MNGKRAEGMLMRVLVYIWVLVWLGGPAAAGPWLREPGHGFASLKTEYDADSGDSYVSLFAEYGWNERLTLGLDMGGTGESMDKAMAFSRVALRWSPFDFKTAMELGAGYYWRQGMRRPVARPGLSIGRGLTVAGRSGWIALDARAVLFQDYPEIDWEGELTFGVNLSERAKAIVQIQGGDPFRSGRYFKLSPSWVWEWRTGRHLELGATAGLQNSKARAVSLALWHHF